MVTSGGRSCSVSIGSMRGLCRDRRSSAGLKSDGSVGEAGCKKILRSVRNAPCGSGSLWYTRLQYLEIEHEQLCENRNRSGLTLQPQCSLASCGHKYQVHHDGSQASQAQSHAPRANLSKNVKIDHSLK